MINIYRSAIMAFNMTQSQFAALSKLISMRAGAAREAARLHFVDGLSVPDAARDAGCSYRSAWQAVQRAKVGMELVRNACYIDTKRNGTSQ